MGSSSRPPASSHASRSLLAGALATAGLVTPLAAAADEPPPPSSVAPLPSLPLLPLLPPPAPAAYVAPPPAPRPALFRVDVLGDGAYLAGTLTLDALSGVLLTTGEVRPQQIAPTFQTGSLLGIDRAAARETVDKSAGPLSTAALLGAVGFAALDPVLEGFRDGPRSALVDAVLYAESLTTVIGLTSLVKVAVRRPRPIAYIDRAQAIAAGADPKTYDNAATDSSLSFFSGHASTVAAVSATATYLAFARSPHSARPWWTLAAGTALTAFVSVERVRAGAHFPTDVITGALAGATVGVLVPHLHRLQEGSASPVVIGVAPSLGGAGGPSGARGGAVEIRGAF